MSKEYESQRATGQQVIATELAKQVGLAAEGQAHANVARIHAEGDASRSKSAAKREARNAEYWSNRALSAEKIALSAQDALAQKEALLKEWMHSHFSFRLLSRKYGARLGISDEQRQKDLDDCVLEIAGDKPEFADTKATNAVKKERGIK